MAEPRDPQATKMVLSAGGEALAFVATEAWDQFRAWQDSHGAPAPLPDDRMRAFYTTCAKKMLEAADAVTT